ncbi:hypothetical protein SADUNF_Sadunf06G0100600 [Salix dunnii]|uniref:S-adenosylmethionine synthase n=1 Tax=Salix dunnii TaxID=1413687 RepID=A0A835K1R4_9ROSI|nr:hypothetical protein SADUNF_Sadunf06G0100600 [Salix dunnii]
MTTPYKLPSFVSFSYHKPFLYHKQQQREINFATCVCSIKKPRGSRKVKSNAELCNDLREFASTFGLPEGHVPSFKELQDHGRNDLANVVRRRGYKLIRDLLSSSTESDSDELPNMGEILAKGQDAINHSADIIATASHNLEGQDEKVKDCSLSTEGTITVNHSGNIDVEPGHKSGGQICMPIELPVDLSSKKKALYDVEQPEEQFQIIVEDRLLSSSLSAFEQKDEEIKCMVEDNSMLTSLYDEKQQGEEDLSMVKQFSLSADVFIADSNLGFLNVYPDLNSNDDTSIPVETSANFSLEEKVKSDSVQDEKFSIGAEEMSLSSEVSDSQYYPNVKNISGLSDDNNSCMPANSSLVEKVEKFIQNGDLDAIEGIKYTDNVYSLSDGSGSGESKGFREPRDMTEDHSKISSEESFEDAVGASDTVSTLNGNLSTSMPSVTVSHTLRNESPTEGIASADVDQDLDTEMNKKDNQVEINHLKFILHQKELELSQLKEQIEKEKLALSSLQTKAEREISKAQKLISEKDAELLVAEESLAGLVEVEVQYCGNGEMVEVAGSFNGWHHPVRLDPQPPSSIKDHFGSRKSRLWSAMLWLYPGVYEATLIPGIAHVYASSRIMYQINTPIFPFTADAITFGKGLLYWSQNYQTFNLNFRLILRWNQLPRVEFATTFSKSTDDIVLGILGGRILYLSFSAGEYKPAISDDVCWLQMGESRNDWSSFKMDTFLFTSESVNEGHPDKLCDQVSDAILDACLAQDPESKVACETCSKTNMVMVFGEITTKANVDYEKIVRDTCRGIGFTSADVGLDADNCKVLVNIEQQSPDIAQGVHGHLTKKPEEIGAGDQGHMFGYATDETPELMPLTHVLATKLGAKLTEVRKNKTCPWLRPDGKTQVTVEYKNEGGAMVPIRVHTILISTQHDENVTNEEIAADLKEHVIEPVIPAQYLDDKTIFHLNPSGRFVIGGPHGDAGLTGRKIIIDTYGGWGAHGGGAFSGKDPTKVDRSGAYIVRQAAKSVVASGLARRCIVQVSYAIGVPEPLSVFVDTYKTGKIPDRDILELIKENFDFRPGMIAINLDLMRGGDSRYQKTAAYGHFGRDDPDFTWETVKLLKPKA